MRLYTHRRRGSSAGTMPSMPMDSSHPNDRRIDDLVAIEARLVHDLERCIPPVDQHRRELERIRADLARLRAGRSVH